jgi:hypothetical protein
MSKHSFNGYVFTISIALFLTAILLFAGFLVSVSSLLAMAQQQTTTTPLLPPPPASSSSGTTGQATPSISGTSPSSPTLTPQEQEQLNRLQNVIAATNLNLDETEKQIGGIVYTPRWSDPVWIEPDSSAVLIAYCLPGEFAESGQEILGGGGGFELEVLESYEVALPQNFTAWMMVIGNEDRQNRFPAAVGVICASDANNVETRVVSPQEQQQINNVVQQFRTTTSIDQVINVINNNNNNNNTTNQNTTTPTTPGGTTPTTPGGTGTPTTPGTPVTAAANPAIYNNVPCPSPLEFTGTITSNAGNREVAYRFIFSTGAATPEQIIHFGEPGSQTVSYTSPGIAPPSLQGWVAIEIVHPFQLQSNQAEMQITCTATPPSGGGITATLSANPATYDGACPVRIEVSGTITDNVGNRDVVYRFIRSDGSAYPAETIHFDVPGSKSVSDYWQLSATGQHWMAIEILQPVQLQSNRADFQITCPPSAGGAPPAAAQTLQADNTTATDDDDEDDTTPPPPPPPSDDDEAGGAGGDTGGGTADTDNADQSPPAGTTTTGGAGAGDTTGGGTADTDGDEPQ